MFGDGKVKNLKKGVAGDSGSAGAAIMKTEIFTYKATTPAPTSIAALTAENGWNPNYTAPNGTVYKKINPKIYAADTSGKEGKNIAEVNKLEDGQKYFCSYDLKIEGSVIEVSANSFPGTLAA